MKCNSKHFRWGKGSHGDDPRPGDVTTLQMDTKVMDRRLKVTIMCKNHAFPPPPIIVWVSSRSVLVIPLLQKHTSVHLCDETFVQYLGNHKILLKRVMGDVTRTHHPDSDTQRDNLAETLWFT